MYGIRFFDQRRRHAHRQTGNKQPGPGLVRVGLSFLSAKARASQHAATTDPSTRPSRIGAAQTCPRPVIVVGQAGRQAGKSRTRLTHRKDRSKAMGTARTPRPISRGMMRGASGPVRPWGGGYKKKEKLKCTQIQCHLERSMEYLINK